MFIIDDIIAAVINTVSAGVQFAGVKRGIDGARDAIREQEILMELRFNETQQSITAIEANEDRAAANKVKLAAVLIVAIMAAIIIYLAVKTTIK